ncbi:hypothetical protein PanWU01x14_102990 [Parasponia andersonii]|uniref:Uncharacterized protein n=1 Tax=Parasponia andersonii TaxID=3476 RepID=A0A2P5D2F9_PARAD|nr:hypothetical protein PanWU01x14_102990 [Parasponia andersonii]
MESKTTEKANRAARRKRAMEGLSCPGCPLGWESGESPSRLKKVILSGSVRVRPGPGGGQFGQPEKWKICGHFGQERE